MCEVIKELERVNPQHAQGKKGFKGFKVCSHSQQRQCCPIPQGERQKEWQQHAILFCTSTKDELRAVKGDDEWREEGEKDILVSRGDISGCGMRSVPTFSK